MSIIPRIAGSAAFRLGSTALTRHPVFRAAQLVWEAKQWLPEPYANAPDEDVRDSKLASVGFSRCWKCNDELTHQYVHDPSACYAGCFDNQGTTPTGVYGSPIGASTSRTNRGVVFMRSSHLANRYHWRELWIRSAGQPGLAAGWNIEPGPVLTQPSTAKMPVPYRLAPQQKNSSVREAGYGPSTSTRHRRPPPGGELPTRFSGPKHRRPGKKERERKFSLMSGGKLRNLIEAAFEGTEWVADLHDALPKDCQVNGTVAENFVAVASCLHRLDVCKAVENRVNNHIEDKIIGVLGQAAKKSAIGSGKSYGLGGITKKLGKPYFAEDGSLQFDPTLPFSIPKVSICG